MKKIYTLTLSAACAMAVFAGEVEIRRTCDTVVLDEPVSGANISGPCNPYANAPGQKGENLVGVIEANATSPVEKGTVLEITVTGGEVSSSGWVFSSERDAFSPEANGDEASGFKGEYVYADGGYKARIYVEENLTSNVRFKFDSPVFSENSQSASAKACLLKEGEQTKCSDVTASMFGGTLDKNYYGRNDYVFPIYGSVENSDALVLWLRVKGGAGEKTVLVEFPSFVEPDAQKAWAYDFTDGKVAMGWDGEASRPRYFNVRFKGEENVLAVRLSGDAGDYESHVLLRLPLTALKFKDAPAGAEVSAEVSGDVEEPFSFKLGNVTDSNSSVIPKERYFLVEGDFPGLQKTGNLVIKGDYPGRLKKGGYFTLRLPRGFRFPYSIASLVRGTVEGIELVRVYGDTNDRALFRVTEETSLLEGEIYAYATPYAETGVGTLVVEDGYEEDPGYPLSGITGGEGNETVSYLWVYRNGKEKPAKVLGSDRDKIESGKETNLTVFCETDPAVNVAAKLEKEDGTLFSPLKKESNESEGRFVYAIPPLPAGEKLEARCYFFSFKDGTELPEEIIAYSENPLTVKVVDDAPLTLVSPDGKEYGTGYHTIEMEDDENLTFSVKGASGKLSVTTAVNVLSVEYNATDVVILPKELGEANITVSDLNDKITLDVKVYPSMITKTVPLRKGWNMIASPGPVEVNSSIVRNYTKWAIAAYEPKTGTWRWESSMKPFAGYWLYADEEKDFIFSYPRRKEANETETLNVLKTLFVPGKWNLLGTPKVLDSSKVMEELNASVIWRYEGGKWFRNPKTIPAGGSFYVK